MSPEEAGPLQQKLWADLGLDTVAAESKVNGAGEGRKNEAVKLIPPGVIHAATSHAGIVKSDFYSCRGILLQFF